MALVRPTNNIKVRVGSVKEVYSDFYTNLDAHPDTLDVLKYSNEDAVKRSIKNILQTNSGERLFNPTFGSDIRSLLFENITPVTQSLLREYIQTAISNHEPRAQLHEVMVSGYEDENAYDITVIFSTINTTEPIKLSLILNRIR